MANVNHTATQNTPKAAVRPTLKYEDFTNGLCMEVFTTKSEIVATRALLAGAIDTDTGDGIHIDALLIDIDSKLQALVDKLNDSIRSYD